jgi:aminopeptidase N
MARLDPHSYADDAQPHAEVLDWKAHVDFSTRTLTCEATLTLSETAAEASPFDLDTRDLRLESIQDQNGDALTFELADPEPILGSRLRIQLRERVSQVRIRYRTEQGSTALQWLEPLQTEDKLQPFVYTQCQPIHARSIVPLQDTPRTRLRFTAALTAPAELTALMAAEARSSRLEGANRVSEFQMSQPIAPYLFAFAVGHLESRDLGPRCRVWAEPSVVEAAGWEFADTERMLEIGERLFGAYDWGRYDVLVLPPSFPYGGMENPRLTFLTSAVLAGDRSLVAVVAHELAHSWTGNLISNATADHFWLNEGWTTYAQRRIVEAVWGADVAALDWALGKGSLDEALQRFERIGQPELTLLRTHLEGVDPDDAFSVVPYEKGALFVLSLEHTVGRTRFDAFIREYIAAFRFTALTTEEFVRFARTHLGEIETDAWLHQPGLPPDAPAPVSERLSAIRRLDGRVPSTDETSDWTAIEWQIYLDSATDAMLPELDRRFDLTRSQNYDVLARWLTLAARGQYQPAYPRLEEFLCRVGRIKYLRPLYESMVEVPALRAVAERTFERCGSAYHPIARAIVADVLARPAQ